MNTRMRALRADAWMLLASAIWGAAFVAQREIAGKLDAGSIAALRFLAGGLLLLAADVMARWLMAPQELPVGALTAVLGGVYLLWLMHRRPG